MREARVVKTVVWEPGEVRIATPWLGDKRISLVAVYWRDVTGMLAWKSFALEVVGGLSTHLLVDGSIEITDVEGIVVATLSTSDLGW